MDSETNPLSDILAENLDLIIVGFNPSLVSWAKGHHYTNPVNNFYRLLFSAGLTPRLLKPEEDAELPEYGIGLTNFVVDVPSANETAIPLNIYRASAAALEEKIIRLQPQVVSFNGLKLYNYFFGRKLSKLGLQAEKIGGRPLFVTPSSSGAANMYFEQRKLLYAELKNFVDTLTEQERI